jgi:hypothetical protein
LKNSDQDVFQFWDYNSIMQHLLGCLGTIFL